MFHNTIHFLYKIIKGSFITGLLLLPFISVHAELVHIRGIVVDSESRKKLDNVNIELRTENEVLQQHTLTTPSAFSIKHDLFLSNNDVDDQYKLVFIKEGYDNHEVNISNIIKHGSLPKSMTISMGNTQTSFAFKGKTLDRKNHSPLKDINISMKNLMTGEISKQVSNQNGEYTLDVVSGYEYDVTIESSHFLKRFAKINYCKDKLDKRDKYCFSGFNDISLNKNGNVSGSSVLLDKVEIGKKFRVDNIYYDYNRATLRSDAIPNLRKVLYILNDNPQISIELGSHADSRGSDNYNFALSERRAASAVNYIIGKGIDAQRIGPKGYGETVLLNHCANDVKCSDKEHEKNRRTEFIITGIDESKI